ncbi:MAG: hypothetical protein ACKVOT_17980, partial [Polaromonas sp.]
PNRTVKRLSADDSADSRVKVGHRQALTPENARAIFDLPGFSISACTLNKVLLIKSLCARPI